MSKTRTVSFPIPAERHPSTYPVATNRRGILSHSSKNDFVLSVRAKETGTRVGTNRWSHQIVSTSVIDHRQIGNRPGGSGNARRTR